MVKKKQIGILAICLLTFIIGVVLVSAERPTDFPRDTKYVEVLRIGNVQELEDITVDLSGYKEVQISYEFLFDSGKGYIEMRWKIDSLDETIGPYVFQWGPSSTGDGHESLIIRSNKLNVKIFNPVTSSNDYVKIIFYATK
jgi:hypothetical protein